MNERASERAPLSLSRVRTTTISFPTLTGTGRKERLIRSHSYESEGHTLRRRRRDVFRSQYGVNRQHNAPSVYYFSNICEAITAACPRASNARALPAPTFWEKQLNPPFDFDSIRREGEGDKESAYTRNIALGEKPRPRFEFTISCQPTNKYVNSIGCNAIV